MVSPPARPRGGFKRGVAHGGTGRCRAWRAGAAAQGRPASAKSPIPQKDAERLQTGYANILYLLENWDKETSNQRGERDSNAVRQYLGLRSTTDPLFNIEKVLTKATSEIEPDMQEEYQEALEKWGYAIDYGNTDSYISAFGEFNPGGGKETVLRYLNKAKESVVIAKSSLVVFHKALKIELPKTPMALKTEKATYGASLAR